MHDESGAGRHDAITNSASADVVLVDENNLELLAFHPFNRSMDEIASMPPLGKASLSHFSQLLSNAPQIATLSAANSKQLVMCSIDFDKLIDASDNAGKLGIARKEGSTKIGEHVRLTEPENLKSLVTTGMVFNIVSTLVAQQHLAEINKKLQSIQTGINQIISFQKNERSSHIEAFHEEIGSCIKIIISGKPISQKYLSSLHTKITKCRSISLHLKKDFVESLVQLKNSDSTSIFGSDSIRRDLEEKIRSAGETYKQYMLVMQCLLFANAILFFHDDTHEENRDAVQRYLNELSADDGIAAQWKIYQNEVKLRLNKMHSWLEFKSSTQANTLLVEKAATKVQNQLTEDKESLNLLSTIFFPKKQTKIVLECDGEKVVGGKYLR